jgi:hypothetical protein
MKFLIASALVLFGTILAAGLVALGEAPALDYEGSRSGWPIGTSGR